MTGRGCRRVLDPILGCAVVFVVLLRVDELLGVSATSSGRSPSTSRPSVSSSSTWSSNPPQRGEYETTIQPDNDGSSAGTCGADKLKTLHPMKVCVLVEPSPFHYISGYSGRFKNLVLYLKERGDDVHVVVPGDSRNKGSVGNHRGRNRTNPDELWNGVPIHFTKSVRLKPWYPDLVVSIDYALRIPRLLWRIKPDLIHVSSPGFLVFAAVVYGRLFRIPVIASYHTHLPIYVQSHYLPKPVRKLAAWLVWQLIRGVHGSMVDLTVVTSPQIRDEFVQHGVPVEQCHVWRKGIDPNTFHPKHACAEMRQRITDHHPDDFVLLYVGRLSVEKRLALLRPVLDHLDRLNRNSSTNSTNVRLCFVGSGPQEEELRTLFDGTPTVFAGVLTGTELSQAFASADVFVMPSDSETLGFVVLEAMASGVVPVVAKAGGLLDLVEHDITGFLVDTSTDHDEFAERFAAYVHQLQNDIPLRRTMGQRARMETLQWSWSASMESLRENEYTMAIQRFRDRWDQRLWRFLAWQTQTEGNTR